MTVNSLQKRDLDIGFVQTVEDVYFLIPTEEDVQKPDLSLQVFPNRLDLKVKGDTLLSGDFPEAVDVDGRWLLSSACCNVR